MAHPRVVYQHVIFIECYSIVFVKFVLIRVIRVSPAGFGPTAISFPKRNFESQSIRLRTRNAQTLCYRGDYFT